MDACVHMVDPLNVCLGVFVLLFVQALINYALFFLEKKGFTAMHCPFFIRQSMMGLAAQLEDFDEQLYKVTGEGEDKYVCACCI